MITLRDIKVYPTLSGEYRAYVRDNASIEAWGYNEDSAIRSLVRVLINKGILFDMM